MTILGERSPVEQEHDLDPLHVLLVAWPPDDTFLEFGVMAGGMRYVTADAGAQAELVTDETGAIPVFATAATAGACLEGLRGLLPGLQLAAVRCWGSFVAQAMAEAELRQTPCGGEPRAAAELENMAYLVEARAHGLGDALMEARAVARRVTFGWAERFERLIEGRNGDDDDRD